MDEKQQWPRVPPTRRALKPSRWVRRTAALSPPPQCPAPRGARGAEDRPAFGHRGSGLGGGRGRSACGLSGSGGRRRAGTAHLPTRSWAEAAKPKGDVGGPTAKGTSQSSSSGEPGDERDPGVAIETTQVPRFDSSQGRPPSAPAWRAAFPSRGLALPPAASREDYTVFVHRGRQ